jgi:hypothetical protein
MCLETLSLWVWSSACVQPTFSPHSPGDPPWALSCCHRVCWHCIAEYVQLSQSLWSLRSQSNVNRYIFAEMGITHLVYGEGQGNGCEAQRIYQERYPQPQLPHHTPFASMDRRLREYGSLQINKRTGGLPRTVRTLDLEEAVLGSALQQYMHRRAQPTDPSEHCVASSKGTKTLPLSSAESASIDCKRLSTSLRLLSVVHQSNCRRSPFRRQCVGCRWGHIHTRRDFFNCHNMHMWKPETPHAMSVRAHQQPSSLNVWCGLLNDFLIGPHVLPNRLTQEAYLDFWSTPCHSCWWRFLSGYARACGTCMMEPLPTSISRCAIIWTMHTQGGRLAVVVQWRGRHGHQTSIH